MQELNNVGDFSLMEGVERVESRITRERASRLENAKDVLSFGLSFLDEALGGIFKNDLILLGAKTGFGKSQLAMLIALTNTRAGKRVLFLALEAEEFEIERRLKYQIIADKFYDMPNRPSIRLNFMDWYNGKFDSVLDQLEKEAEEEVKKTRGLITYYRGSSFGVDDFERISLGMKDQVDLIIIDHLHYFDFEDENENRAVKNVVKKIRDCALIHGKPVILIAHVRKSDRRMKQLIPDIEDFHGSSDTGKICTKALTIAPCYDEAHMIPNQRQTYFQILKCRMDASRTNLTGLLSFNVGLQRYEQEYFVGRLSFDGTEFKKLSTKEVPFWASSAVLDPERNENEAGESSERAKKAIDQLKLSG